MMTVLDRLMALARRPPAAVAEAEPATELRQIGQALVDLAAERAATISAIYQLARQREEALLDPDRDSEVAEIDRGIGRQRRQLERLDATEPLLYAQLRDRREAVRQGQFEALKDRFAATVREYASTMRRALDLRAELAAIRSEGEVAGFIESRTLFELPFLSVPSPSLYEHAVLTSLTATKSAAIEPQLVSIRMLRRLGGLNPGMVAGFPAEEAEQYVRLGYAARLPPPPIGEDAS